MTVPSGRERDAFLIFVHYVCDELFGMAPDNFLDRLRV